MTVVYEQSISSHSLWWDEVLREADGITSKEQQEQQEREILDRMERDIFGSDDPAADAAN
jgi:hypothetical protein